MKRVRMFVDHANFDIGWKKRVGRGAADRLDWAKLPPTLMTQIAAMPYMSGAELEMSGIYVYASTHPRPSEADTRYEAWLKFGLDQLPGYTVKQSPRQARTAHCEQGHPFTELSKRAWTHGSRATCWRPPFATPTTSQSSCRTIRICCHRSK